MNTEPRASIRGQAPAMDTLRVSRAGYVQEEPFVTKSGSLVIRGGLTQP